jgi:hypothetical protein
MEEVGGAVIGGCSYLLDVEYVDAGEVCTLIGSGLGFGFVWGLGTDFTVVVFGFAHYHPGESDRLSLKGQ